MTSPPKGIGSDIMISGKSFINYGSALGMGIMDGPMSKTFFNLERRSYDFGATR